jgi:hypothetical protein
MRISINLSLDLSSRSFIPLPRFIRSRRPTTLWDPFLVFSHLSSVYPAYEGFFSKSFTVFLTLHSFIVTLFTLGLGFFICCCKQTPTLEVIGGPVRSVFLLVLILTLNVVLSTFLKRVFQGLVWQHLSKKVTRNRGLSWLGFGQNTCCRYFFTHFFSY